MKTFDELFNEADLDKDGIDDLDEEQESKLLARLWDFFIALNDKQLDSLTDDQIDIYGEIVEMVDDGTDDEEPEEVEEALPAKRVRRDPVARRKRSREHRKVKAKRKIQGRRTRKTAAFKRYTKRKKRFGKRGLTTKGARKRKFINKG